MKILLNTVDINISGGVASYYKLMKDKFKEDVKYFIVGSRIEHESIYHTAIRFMKDNWEFYLKLKKNDYDIIHLNPSLNFKGIFRDAIFLLIAKSFHRKVLIMFHGWNEKFEKLLEGYFLFLFKMVYFKSDAVIVLSSDFKDKIKKWGYKGDVFLGSTSVNDDLLIDSDEDYIKTKFRADKETFVILFLSRIEKDKGIYEAVDAFKIIKNRFNFVKMIIAGDGSETADVYNYVSEGKAYDIEFLGYVSGNFKKQVFMSSDIYILPTTHGEGMPISVLEAMAFGLPVITRSVGGLKDFFEDGKMGYITESKDPKVFAELIEKLILNKSLQQEISIYNNRYAKEHFLASKVAERIENIYKEIVNVD